MIMGAPATRSEIARHAAGVRTYLLDKRIAGYKAERKREAAERNATVRRHIATQMRLERSR